jgi:hypothetical protein
MWKVVLFAVIAMTLSSCLPEARDRQFDRCRLEHKDDVALCMKVNGYKSVCGYDYVNCEYIPEDDFKQSLWRIEEGITHKTIADFVPTADTLSGIATMVFIVPQELASMFFTVIFLQRLYHRLSRRYAVTLRGNEKKVWIFWSIYLIASGAITALIYRTEGEPGMFFLGGWECFVGVVILVLGPNWWGTYERVDSKTKKSGR